MDRIKDIKILFKKGKYVSEELLNEIARDIYATISTDKNGQLCNDIILNVRKKDSSAKGFEDYSQDSPEDINIWKQYIKKKQ